MSTSFPFDPFNDRLSRDIRNDLSSSLVQCLTEGNITPARRVADGFIKNTTDQHYLDYIESRINRYEQAVKTITDGSDDPIWRGLVLWDLGLFFEMHEVLEHAWYSAVGDTKLIMQALIRAAGMYVKLEHGFIPQAKKMAGRAIPVIEQHQDFLREYFAPEVLIEALATANPTPPKLLSGM